MKRTVGYLLAALGVALLVAAPLLRFYDVPRLEKTPLNFYFVERATGVGTYLDPSTLTLHHDAAMTVTRTLKGDPKAGSGSTAVWNVFAQTTGADGNVVQLTNERWTFNRHSGVSTPATGETPQHQGQWLRFPFNTKKQSYQYWDSTANKAFPAQYSGTKTILGHKVYEFTSVVPPTLLETLAVPGSLIGQSKPTVLVDLYYQNPKSVIDIEPRTGTPVTGSSHRIETFRLHGTSQTVATVLDITLTPTDATVKGLMKKATDGMRSLDIVGTWLPLGFLIVGIGCVVAAVRLLRTSEPVAEAPRTIVLPEQRLSTALRDADVPVPRTTIDIETPARTAPKEPPR